MKLGSSANELVALRLSQVGADQPSLSKVLVACSMSQSLISLDISNPGMNLKNDPITPECVKRCLQPAILNGNLQYLNLLNCGLKDTGLAELVSVVKLL